MVKGVREVVTSERDADISLAGQEHRARETSETPVALLQQVSFSRFLLRTERVLGFRYLSESRSLFRVVSFPFTDFTRKQTSLFRK